MPGSDNLAVRPYCERSDTDMVEQAFESDESGNPSAEEDALVQHNRLPMLPGPDTKSAASGAQDVPKSTIVL
jgi:hypothetical protein